MSGREGGRQNGGGSRGRGRAGGARRRRAQTVPDFAIGIAVFLVTVTFVAVLVPQLVLPFEDPEQSVVAERATADLANDRLTDRGAPSKLNESGTRSFFDGTESDALDALGVPGWYDLNVTLRSAPSTTRNATVACAVAGDDWLDPNCSSGGDRLAVGPAAPRDDESVATARRTLYAVGVDVVLEVRVW